MCDGRWPPRRSRFSSTGARRSARLPRQTGVPMKRMAWTVPAAAGCGLGWAPGASASLVTNDTFISVSAASATFGPKDNVLTVDARRDNLTDAMSGSLNVSGEDTLGLHSIDATPV